MSFEVLSLPMTIFTVFAANNALFMLGSCSKDSNVW
jgi:hypothetical protein